MHEPEPDLFSHGDRRAIEIAGMNAVMEIERRLGYIPTDVSATKCGYDIICFGCYYLVPVMVRNERRT